MAINQSIGQSWNTFNLRQFPVGSEILFEINGVKMGDELMTPNQRWTGRIVDPEMAFVEILTDSERQLAGRTIGLASGLFYRPHIETDKRYPVTLQKTLVPGGMVEYYDPDDIDPTYQGCARLEKIQKVLGYYAHVVADEHLVF
jgi:hypothetical protein